MFRERFGTYHPCTVPSTFNIGRITSGCGCLSSDCAVSWSAVQIKPLMDHEEFDSQGWTRDIKTQHDWADKHPQVIANTRSETVKRHRLTYASETKAFRWPFLVSLSVPLHLHHNLWVIEELGFHKEFGKESISVNDKCYRMDILSETESLTR